MALQDRDADMEPTAGHRSSVGFLHRFLRGSGIVHLWQSPTDIKLLVLQRYIRVTAFGAMALILVEYLRLLGISEARIGYFMTATLLGDVGVSLLLAAYGDRIGRRRVLVLGCLAMTISGLIFAFSTNYWLLLVAAVFGVITPSGSDLGPLRVIEESTISHLTEFKDRPTIYAWYVLCGRFGAASGMLLCGWALHGLSERGWTTLESYHAAFYYYAASGLLKLLTTLCLSAKCDETRTIVLPEPVKPADSDMSTASLTADEAETAPLLKKASSGSAKTKGKWNLLDLAVLPSLSPESRRICLLLCFFYIFEYIGNAMASLSWLAYYFQKMFELSDGQTGSIFFASQLGGGVLALVGAAAARRIGNIPTIFGVATIADAGLVILGLVTSLPAAITAVIIRDSVQQAEGGAVMSLNAGLFLPSERTAALGLCTVVKTLASSVGPSITGLLVEHNHFWVVFVVAGCSKYFYASGLVFSFLHHKMPEQREAEAAEQARLERTENEQGTDT